MKISLILSALTCSLKICIIIILEFFNIPAKFIFRIYKEPNRSGWTFPVLENLNSRNALHLETLKLIPHYDNEYLFENTAIYGKFSKENLKQLQMLINDFIHHYQIDKQTFDITEVKGFASSKSDLSVFDTVEQFALKNCPSYLEPLSQEKINENLAHHGIGIFEEPPTDSFKIFGWHERLYVMNSDGSHHLSAAIYQLKALQLSKLATAPLSVYLLNKNAIDKFSAIFYIYWLPSELSYFLDSALGKSNAHYLRLHFEHDAKESNGYYCLYIFPRNFKNSIYTFVLNKKYPNFCRCLQKMYQQQHNNKLLKSSYYLFRAKRDLHN